MELGAEADVVACRNRSRSKKISRKEIKWAKSREKKEIRNTVGRSEVGLNVMKQSLGETAILPLIEFAQRILDIELSGVSFL